MLIIYSVEGTRKHQETEQDHSEFYHCYFLLVFFHLVSFMNIGSTHSVQLYILVFFI